MDKYIGVWRDVEDGETYNVYTIEGGTAYIQMSENYLTQAPFDMVRKMVDRGHWVKARKR